MALQQNFYSTGSSSGTCMTDHKRPEDGWRSQSREEDTPVRDCLGALVIFATVCLVGAEPIPESEQVQQVTPEDVTMSSDPSCDLS